MAIACPLHFGDEIASPPLPLPSPFFSLLCLFFLPSFSPPLFPPLSPLLSPFFSASSPLFLPGSRGQTVKSTCFRSRLQSALRLRVSSSRGSIRNSLRGSSIRGVTSIACAFFLAVPVPSPAPFFLVRVRRTHLHPSPHLPTPRPQ